MAEFKMPKFVCKDKPIALDECYQEVAELSYQSPVNILYQRFQAKVEGDIYQAIQSYGVHVDKDELIKALQYDRNQYQKGFIDGCKNNVDTIKAEVAREILEEIAKIADEWSKYCHEIHYLEDDIAELKKKYTEGLDNQ